MSEMVKGIDLFERNLSAKAESELTYMVTLHLISDSRYTPAAVDPNSSPYPSRSSICRQPLDPQ